MNILSNLTKAQLIEISENAVKPDREYGCQPLGMWFDIVEELSTYSTLGVI